MDYRHTVRRAVVLAAALSVAPAAYAETRGYAISWFATATHVEDIKEACPENRNGGIVEMHIRDIARLPGYDLEKAKEEMRNTPNTTILPRQFEDQVTNRAIVKGQRRSAYNYPEAAPDVNLETGVGKYAWGFDLGGKNAAMKYEDPETHEKVDNQLWRALGCVAQFQAGPPQKPYGEDLAWNINIDFAPAWLIQISGKDLNHDGKVTVTLDRATHHLERDAGTAILSGATYIAEPTGRSHNVPAQTTTLGKRFASAADELLVAFTRLEELIERYPLRGIKGPVGTAQDMLDLMGGDEARLGQLESAVARHLGFAHVLDSVGQVYPRSLDLDVVSALVQVAAGPSSLATTIRLMAGHDLVTEGFRPGQVGSSAMPHKMNSRSCERVNGFAVLLRGYLTMVADLSGSQWNEGDVFCSVVRRVALPDAFFAIDGMFETFLTVLDDFGAFPAVIDRELERYLPFLSTTKVLMASVRKGVGRETAHEAIKEHAVAVALAMRESGQSANDLMDRLAADSRLGLSEDELRSLVADPLDFTGAAASQVRAVAERVAAISARYPDAAGYRPGDIL